MTVPVPDETLIDRALGGEAEAFGQLVRRYQDRLFHTFAHVLGRDEDAYDVVQDTFVQAFVKLESFERKAGFYTWIYRIAMNMAATRRRRARPIASIEQLREQTQLEPSDRHEAPEANLDRHETVSAVRGAIARLPDEFRSVLVLREIDGCDYDQIAELLDLPVGTVRSRLHRARLQLRDLLKCHSESADDANSVA